MTTAPVGQIVMISVGILVLVPHITRYYRLRGKK